MKKYGLIGYPLKHSFSVGYFNEKFASEGIDAKYVNFEIPSINDFTEVIDKHPDLCGLNVTIPYQEKVIPFLNGMSPDAESIGDVTVIQIERPKKYKIKTFGHNSDITWCLPSIERLFIPKDT